jgi:transposase
MTQATASIPVFTIGIDLGDKKSHFCVLDQEGTKVQEGTVPTREPALQKLCSGFPGARVAFETSTHSAWVERALRSVTAETIVANPRQMAVPASKKRRKNDRIDAEHLARLARVDPKLLCPIQHRSYRDQATLSVIRMREVAVGVRTQLINSVRGTLKSLGCRLGACDANRFHKTAREALPPALLEIVEPMLTLIEASTNHIKSRDKAVDDLAAQHNAVPVLTQIKGVGNLTAMTFILTLQSHERFRRSRRVGAYLGLVPHQFQSGDSDPEFPISKAGDRLLRRLLVTSAHYILGPLNKQDSDLRRFGLAMAGTRNKTAKKRAVVAVARRLAVLLLSLWRSREVYEPLRHTDRRAALATV